MNRRTRARKQQEWKRTYHSEAFVRFTRESASVASGEKPVGGCVCAHVTPQGELPSGMGRKADARWVVPLSAWEHMELHMRGEQSFENKYGIDLDLEATAHWYRFHEHNDEEDLSA